MTYPPDQSPGDRRRRRPNEPAATPPSDTRRVNVPSQTEDAEDAKFGESTGFENLLGDPRRYFPHWDKILPAVRDAYSATVATHAGDWAEANTDEGFYKIVNDTVNRHPEFEVVQNKIPDLSRLIKEWLFGEGPMGPYLSIDGLEEISLNRYDQMFITVRGKTYPVKSSPFRSDKEVRNYLDMVFGRKNREINDANPSQDSSLEDGSRIHANLPPMSPMGACFSIRKFRVQKFTIEDYVNMDVFTPEFADSLHQWVDANFNMIISGGTASGKAQPLDANILTPKGWKKMGEMNVGDLVIGKNGKSYPVTGIFPQGKKRCFEFKFANGGNTRACNEHLWAVRKSGSCEEFQIRNLDQMLSNGLIDQDGCAKYEVPSFEGKLNSYFSMRNKEFALSGVSSSHPSFEEAPVKALITKTQRGNALISVREISPCQMQCISVGSPDNLYITDDYIVTHNTTLMNAVGGIFPPYQRLIIIEDRKELQIEQPNMVYLQETGAKQATGKRGEETGKTIRDALRDALRMRPRRIIVGEVRGHEAFDMLQAMNTGHDGSMSSLHANTAREAVMRLESMAAASHEPVESLQPLIAWAVDIVIQINQLPDQEKREITEAWQIFHPNQLEQEAKAKIPELRKQGIIAHINGEIWGAQLFKREQTGELVKIMDALPISGKKIRPLQ